MTPGSRRLTPGPHPGPRVIRRCGRGRRTSLPTCPLPTAPPRRPPRLRLGLGGDGGVRHRAGADAAALPHRQPRHRRAGGRLHRLPAEGLGRHAQPRSPAGSATAPRPARPAAALAAARRDRRSRPAFALLFAAPEMGSKVLERGVGAGVLPGVRDGVRFFQVPYVSMPAEMTASYDERTRLMTWRVAILAFTIMLAGATAPLIRDAVGGRAGYRVMGVAMALVILVGVVGAYVGTRHAPVGAVAAGGRQPARPAADRGRGARLPAAAHHVRAPGARHRLHARRRRLPGQRRARPAGAATILFVCFVGPALLLTPAWSAVGTRFGKKRATSSPRSCWRRARCSPSPRAARRALVFAATPWSGSGTPAARCSRSRCCPTRPPSTRGAPAATGPGSTPACGPRARRWGWRWARARSRSCSPSAATGPRPTATSPSRAAR